MGARNRGTYSYSGRRGNGLPLIRSLLIFAALAAISFGFGFMVVARMLPMGARNEIAPTVNQGSASDIPKDHDTNAASVASASLHPAEIVTPQVRKPQPAPGPSIDPSTGDTKMQQPSAIDSAAPANATTVPPAPDPAAQASTANVPSTTDTMRVPVAPTPHRRHHKKDGIQPATNPDAQNVDTVPSGNDPNTAGVPAKGVDSSAGLYRVQFGVYSTREAADAVAREAGDKSLDASIQSYEQDGRTLYRVTHGLFRRKANADTARQRLTDAGFDATISRPQ